jgi:DNA-binding Lrp family transcriptional regulator
MTGIDALDARIMYELDLDARQPVSKLAHRLRRSKETVNFRLNRLVKEGYLKGFYTVFNTSQLGWYYYKFYLKFKNITPGKEKELFDYVRKKPRIAYLSSVEGFYDAIILLAVRNAGDIVDFMYPFMKLYGDYIQTKDTAIFLTTHRLNNRFIHAGETRRDWHYGVEIGNYPVDEVDRKIMRAITREARLPLVEIAERTGVDAKVVKYRLSKLKSDKIILAYVTAPNFDKLGLEFYQINISLKAPEKMREVLEFFDSTNACLFALEMVGRYDLAVELHLRSGEELKKIIDAFREKFVDAYNDYDVSTITKEYVVLFGPY